MNLNLAPILTCLIVVAMCVAQVHSDDDSDKKSKEEDKESRGFGWRDHRRMSPLEAVQYTPLAKDIKSIGRSFAEIFSSAYNAYSNEFHVMIGPFFRTVVIPFVRTYLGTFLKKFITPLMDKYLGPYMGAFSYGSGSSNTGQSAPSGYDRQGPGGGSNGNGYSPSNPNYGSTESGGYASSVIQNVINPLFRFLSSLFTVSNQPRSKSNYANEGAGRGYGGFQRSIVESVLRMMGPYGGRGGYNQPSYSKHGYGGAGNDYGNERKMENDSEEDHDHEDDDDEDHDHEDDDDEDHDHGDDDDEDHDHEDDDGEDNDEEHHNDQNPKDHSSRTSKPIHESKTPVETTKVNQAASTNPSSKDSRIPHLHEEVEVKS